ncbi:hypothetical protein CANTEDRAFT_124496 [Yamadazyma tenuis ATCC 10573]|uniref:RING-type domain-containing protein n=2 Tax=Candida tenuis TaxID=2315449 RepID=G3B7A2_CANTC|nr:uncharacterized protein CANTEDRAFT_124496 [Yamadazyma tenuis ATCC 10573]EGV61607.1 hypothetical protein CANTEDRAFT_124496 [Yamadazyma tenuis ATCC 10573]
MPTQSRKKSGTVPSHLDSQLWMGKKVNGNNRQNQISLNHLIHYQPYKESDEYKSRHSKPKSRRLRSSRNSFNDPSADRYKVPLRGMGFINLNYKFVVDYRGDYKSQEIDPNVPVSPENVIRIVVPTGNACPICLSDTPIAPRMITSCGHILCLKCLLSLLDTEIPTNKKKQSAAVVEKYNDCPLCSSIIRKNETKPALILDVDDRFETPKVGDDVIMSLMSRPHSRLFAVPRAIEEIHYQIKNFPSVDMTDPDLTPYSRLFKADLVYIFKMYNQEKEQILKTYAEEKELYNDDGKYSMLAIDEINKDIDRWVKWYNQEESNPIKAESIVKNDNIDSSNSFFYYETGFNARATFVLSPLDIKVLKSNYNNEYGNLPSVVIAKVENIQYEELTPENSLKKYKYLSHLPWGTSIGFLQCNWHNNEYISNDTWELFKDDLVKRTKKSQRKFEKEDRAKKRAETEEERKAMLFYERENDPSKSSRFEEYHELYDEELFYGSANFGSLSIIDNRELPLLSSEGNEEEAVDSDESSVAAYETTVWGTKVKKSENSTDPTSGDDWDAEEMIRKAKEEMERQEEVVGKKKNKKKKKLVLLSSNY